MPKMREYHQDMPYERALKLSESEHKRWYRRNNKGGTSMLVINAIQLAYTLGRKDTSNA